MLLASSGKSLEMWLISYHAQDSPSCPPTKNYLAQNVSSTEAERPHPTPRPVGSPPMHLSNLFYPSTSILNGSFQVFNTSPVEYDRILTRFPATQSCCSLGRKRPPASCKLPLSFKVQWTPQVVTPPWSRACLAYSPPSSPSSEAFCL